jgi:hypothetical protein
LGAVDTDASSYLSSLPRRADGPCTHVNAFPLVNAGI